MKTIITNLLLIFMGCSLSAQNEIDCKIYNSGFFVFKGELADFLIYRHKDYQIEYNLKTDQWVTIKLSWTEDCNYSFVYVSSNVNMLKPYIGEEVKVIIETIDAKGYTFHTEYKNELYYGQIIFPKKKLKGSIKRTLRKKLRETKY